MPFNVTIDSAHVAEALALLLEQYKRKDNIAGLLSSYIAPIQDLENVAYDLWTKFLLDSATGAQLDLLGATVREDRGGKSDTDYRAFIKARIAINRSNGRAGEILNVLRLISAAGDVFYLDEVFPAAMVVYQDVDPAAFAGDETVYIDILKQAKGGGIQVQFVWSERASTARFTLSSSNTLETSNTLGLANDAQTTGGHLSGVVS